MEKLLATVTAVVITYFAVRLVTRIFRIGLESYVRRQPNGEEKLKQLKGIVVVVNILLWVTGALVLFNNLGYNITAIITGLGIGGIAIALAAQNILGDLFNYFVIFFDRPFEAGDYITVDDKKGHIEHIGIKTTRIRSLSGEELIISNSDLTKSRLHNYKRMTRRRVLFTLAIAYHTTEEKVKQIPVSLRNIIERQPQVTFDRAHFSAYGVYGLNFEVVYFVESADYNDYMDSLQRVNFSILEEFKKQGIEFAFLTQGALTGSGV
jgi:small-conductance mechanosensitive channel